MSKTKTIEDTILAEYGDIITNAAYVANSRKAIIPTTPKVDLILDGGIPEGSFVTITGPPGVGKSSLALKIAAEAQKIPSDWGERIVYYSDVEGRIKKRDLFGTTYLDTSEEKFRLIQSKEGKILTGEDFLNINSELINGCPGYVFIIDSFSSLCSEERYKADGKTRIRDNVPLLLSHFCKTIAQVIPINKCLVIGITHQIANQSGFGQKKWNEASGEKIKYQADVKLKGTHCTPWVANDVQVGQQIHWQCEKSALGGPGKKTESWLRYGKGIDETREMMDLAVGCNMLKISGAWAKLTLPEGFEDLGPEKGDNKGLLILNGQEKMREALEQNQPLFNAVKKEVRRQFFDEQ